jgi:hypothetical protein
VNILNRRSFSACVTSLMFSALAYPANVKRNSISIGVNCFDLFYALLFPFSVEQHPNYRLRDLSRANIPFVRFSASPFWPNEWRLYQTDPKEYWKRMDLVFTAADYNGVQLVPSIFWNPVTISDLVGEPVSLWSDERSKTSAFAIKYLGEIIGKYKHYKSVLAWEFGNEFNSFSDMPNALNWWPKTSPSTGTPGMRTDKDRINRQLLQYTFSKFAKLSHELDSDRALTTGADFPQFNADNLARGKFNSDTRVEAVNNLLLINPDLVNWVSIHLYPNRKDKAYGGVKNYHDLLSPLTAAIHNVGKKCFVGEFGVAGTTLDNGELEFQSMIDGMISSGVDYAALWVYDNPAQESSFNVNFKNRRRYQLDIISQLSRL